MSTENTSSQFENIREKFGRFRILIVGRANAGKTTILQKICNTTENPEIYDGDGNKIDPSRIEGSMGRGIHDVENELIFRSNDKFVFHDSQGFEAGSKVEFERTKKFIADRANTTYLKKRLDAIWYCIPMDKIDRAIQRSEEIFFGECDPNNVPVVVLFTKFDALQAKAVLKLAPSDRRLPLQEKLSKLPPLMEEIFNSADVWGRLAKMAYPPKCSVRLENIHKGNEGHNILVENTAAVLSNEVLQMLFVSAQETNIGLCVKYAAERVIISGIGRMCNTGFSHSREEQICRLVCWFPHFQWVSCAFWDVGGCGDADHFMSTHHPALAIIVVCELCILGCWWLW
ncbi:hypothetical protein L210DRAFT_3454449 [Boletus edulis BED1]|uniref:G domain-containing protein n=1 Tax=Boletus edulis BED1 TaxID=1328754 RepID=A0AAD4GAN4_BOLED|nr:hypothetical protein L210DRAFT_3454449 [Boletus edulis BED1]